MPGPVTSKYDTIYWVRLTAITALAIGGIYLLLIAFFNNDSSARGGVLGAAFMVWAACIGIYLLYFRKSPPRKIVVSNENITIYEYLSRKRIVINYSDIDSTRIFVQSSDAGRFSYRQNYLQILQLELYNGETYRISENDFTNYDFLKSAIYDRLPNHRQ
jgi:hypothetical protein